MSNTIQIKHGASVPTTDQLAPYEFGYCTDEGKLYLNANGTIESIFTNNSIKNGFSLDDTRPITTIGEDEDENGNPRTYTLDLIKRSLGTILIGDSDNFAHYQRGIDFYIGNGYDLTVGRVSSNSEGSNSIVYSKIFDEDSIRSGFTLKNKDGIIYTELIDDTPCATLYRSPNNHLWVGGSDTDASTEQVGDVRLVVGTGKDGTVTPNAKVYRKATKTTDIILDQRNIRGLGINLDNNVAIRSDISGSTADVPILFRSASNNTWVGGNSTKRTTSGSVVLAIGPADDSLGEFANVYRGSAGAYSKILDYGYIAKSVWSGSCAVGGTFTIENFADYRFFIVNLSGSNTSMLVMRRGNYLRGGCTYPSSGVCFEHIRCKGNSSGVFTYTESRSYTLTTSGATANWNNSSAPNITGIWGVL